MDNYWIQAIPNIGTVTTDGGVNSAILRYEGADEVEPAPATLTSSSPLAETSLVPLTDLAAPGSPEIGGVDYALNLDFSFDGTDFAINGATFTSPSVPVLLQIMSGASDVADLLPGGSLYSLPSNSTIELSFPVTATNAPGAPHPFHLHGVCSLVTFLPALFTNSSRTAHLLRCSLGRQHRVQLRQPRPA